MTDGKPSATAFRVAMRRAEHQLLDEPKVFDDPLALKIIGADAASFLAAHANPDNVRSRYMRAFMAVRSRFAEDELTAAIRRGVRQYVILGAGLDTFAYRNPFCDIDLQIFEVDHPDTQEWKRGRLRENEISIPGNVRFAPVRFEKETLDSGLNAAGFHLSEPAFFSWLGVTMYLLPELVIDTFRLIHSMCPANGVAFDYAVPRSSLNWLNRLAFDALAERVANAGEPFCGYFEPRQLAENMKSIGFQRIGDFGAEAINERYFRNRADGLRARGSLGRLMSAWG